MKFNPKALQELLTALLVANGVKGAKVQKFNDGWVYGTVNLAGLADTTTGQLVLQNPVELLGKKTGDSGESLGFGSSSQLTEWQTNMDQGGQINSKRALVTRGYGVRVDPWCEYSDELGPLPEGLQGIPLQLISYLANFFTLSYKRGTRDEYNAGPLALNPAGELGPTMTAAATTVNNRQVQLVKNGAGSMIHFDTPNAWQIYAPNDSIAYNVNQKRQFFMCLDPTRAAAADNPRITWLLLQVALRVYDIEQVAN